MNFNWQKLSQVDKLTVFGAYGFPTVVNYGPNHTYPKWYLIMRGYHRKGKYHEDKEVEWTDKWEIKEEEYWKRTYPKMSRTEAIRHYQPEGLKVELTQNVLDKDEIKARVSILNLYAMYFPERRARGSGRYRQVSCGLHGEDKVASMSLDTELNRFNCFCCCEKGDTIDLVMKLEGCNFRSALELMGRL